MLKKKLVILSIGCLVVLAGATTVEAAPEVNRFTGGVAAQGGLSPANETTLAENVGRIISGVLGLVGIIFVSLTIYAGILWMTAGGNETSVEKAQSIIKMSVIGLVIVLAAYSITYFVVRLTGAATAGPPQEATEPSWWDNMINTWFD